MDAVSFDAFVEARGTFPALRRELAPWTDEDLYADFLRSAKATFAEPMDYLKYRFFSKSPDEQALYVTRRQYELLCDRLNARFDAAELTDKARFFRSYGRFAARRAVDPAVDGRAAFDEFCSTQREVVLKPRAGGYGRGIRLAATDDPDALWEACCADGCLAEELIVQHEALRALHPASVNCARVATAVSSCGEVRVLGVVLRVGRAGSLTDSGSGIFAPVDVSSGVAAGAAVDHFCGTYPEHPDTGLRFEGFQLPCWDELVARAEEAALCMPSLRLANWDWACDARKGWVLVEGNLGGGFGPCQEALGRGLAVELEAALR